MLGALDLWVRDPESWAWIDGGDTTAQIEHAATTARGPAVADLDRIAIGRFELRARPCQAEPIRQTHR